MEEIERLLGLQGLNRVESYDISNINGFETVGSMVVFEKGRAKKNDYRKFRIRTVTGPDDYHSMEELLTRRFTHGQRQELAEMDGEASKLVNQTEQTTKEPVCVRGRAHEGSLITINGIKYTLKGEVRRVVFKLRGKQVVMVAL